MSELIQAYIRETGTGSPYNTNGASVFEMYVKARNESRKRQRLIIADFKGQEDKLADSIAIEVVQKVNEKLKKIL